MRTALLLIALLWGASAIAAPTWTVLPLDARGVDRAAVATFRDLLISELGTRNRARFVDGKRPCNDVPCAQQAGRR